jgi:hypothetical protein
VLQSHLACIRSCHVCDTGSTERATEEQVANLICFAASEAAGYITGASLDINGGDLMM